MAEKKSESVVREIKRRTRRKYSAEEKITVILEGLRGEESISAICRREGIVPNLYYRWSKESLGSRSLWSIQTSLPGNWRPTASTHRKTSSPRPVCTASSKSYDLIPSPNYIVMSAKYSFTNPTKRVHELWQTDFTYFKVIDWGWYYLCLVLDDYSRYIIAWKLFTTMAASDVKGILDVTIEKTGGCL